MAFCFDTSALIGCWSRSYPPDVFPGLWVKLEELIARGEVRCPEEVRVELERQEDTLAKWAKARPALFVGLDEPIQVATREVLAHHPRLMSATKSRNGADPFVIATARVHQLTVVTEEQGGTDAKPKIPSVCAALGVPCVNPLGFLRAQGWSFG
jgi:hypothetical protein